MPIVLSLVEAAVTMTASSRPRVSVMTPHLRPAIFLPASMPWVAVGTLVDVFALWLSMMDADGLALRPDLLRTNPFRS
ncbi:hypothetical protein SAMN06264365_13178 [Actinoplanes regularis]|uniref:Uncharacterized protein n=1 Tax=Actinoplanes regularis TaxID=52697 RepID=A0A239J078_9ACTN|nr:hypothetical protein SAMN06264365_13178 [Actinoplanes regularis]